jgi:hypothetical protein
MLTRSVLLAALVVCGLLGSSAISRDAHAAGGRRSGPAVIVSTVLDSGAPVSAIDAESLADLECQAARATAQAKLGKRRASCLRRDARRSGFDLPTCEGESFRKYFDATADLPCDGASDVIGTYTCQGVLCTCRGDDCEDMFENAACGDSVSCAMFGEEAVCSCLPSL